jgi:hypothetical protein
MSAARKRLPDRRASTSFDFECNGLSYVCTFSLFDDGRVGELFLSNHKSGSQAGANARDAAVCCSLALQHSAPLETIRNALLRDPRGKAATPLGEALDRIAAQRGAK